MNQNTEQNTIGTGGFKSPVDPRDWTLGSVGAPAATANQCFINMAWRKASMQAKVSCCVGCTLEEIVAQIIHVIGLATGVPDQELSFRFVYALCKCLDGVPGEGTYPALAAKIARTYGVPLAIYCQNDVTLDHESFVFHRNMANIPAQAYADALKRRSGADFAVPATEDGIKQALTYAKANNGAVSILRRIGKTYFTDVNGMTSWDASKILPIRPTQEIISGHAECLYGYDYELGTGRMRIYWLNHWSPLWASNGRGWEYFDEWIGLVEEIRCVVASVPTVPTFKYAFTKQLSRGSQGPDVVALQHVLMLEGVFPAGQTFTGYFGDVTLNAVIQLQQKHAGDILVPVGLTHGTGMVGPATLAWLNKNYNK